MKHHPTAHTKDCLSQLWALPDPPVDEEPYTQAEALRETLSEQLTQEQRTQVLRMTNLLDDARELRSYRSFTTGLYFGIRFMVQLDRDA